MAAFYSLQDTKAPMKAAIVALIVNALFSLALMFPFRHGGLALATSLASAVNVTMLWLILGKRIGKILDRPFYLSLGKTCLASLVMAGVVGLIGLVCPWQPAAPFPVRFLCLALAVVGGGAAFFGAAWLVRSPEIQVALAAVQRRLAGPGRG